MRIQPIADALIPRILACAPGPPQHCPGYVSSVIFITTSSTRVSALLKDLQQLFRALLIEENHGRDAPVEVCGEDFLSHEAQHVLLHPCGGPQPRTTNEPFPGCRQSYLQLLHCRQSYLQLLHCWPCLALATSPITPWMIYPVILIVGLLPTPELFSPAPSHLAAGTTQNTASHTHPPQAWCHSHVSLPQVESLLEMFPGCTSSIACSSALPAARDTIPVLNAVLNCRC
jgi:hypothetical protein